MTDNTATQAHTGGVNSSLNTRREERAAGELINEGMNRLSDVAADGLEVWQKGLAFNARIAHFWGDQLYTACNSFGQMIQQQQERSQQGQNKRA
jgi:hypothetical protein